MEGRVWSEGVIPLKGVVEGGEFLKGQSRGIRRIGEGSGGGSTLSPDLDPGRSPQRP